MGDGELTPLLKEPDSVHLLPVPACCNFAGFRELLESIRGRFALRK
jgi:hypothetical protein